MVHRYVVQPSVHLTPAETAHNAPHQPVHRDAHPNATRRDASRRMQYLIELEDLLDIQEARHREETARLARELAQARSKRRKSPERA